MGQKLHGLILSCLLVYSAQAAQTNVVTVTAYCACKECCGPLATGITASGKKPRQGTTAAGPRALPIGTKVWIEGVGKRIVQDRTAQRYDGRFDVYFRRHKDAKAFGIRQVKVVY